MSCGGHCNCGHGKKLASAMDFLNRITSESGSVAVAVDSDLPGAGVRVGRMPGAHSPVIRRTAAKYRR